MMPKSSLERGIELASGKLPHVLEFGVYTGRTMKVLAKRMRFTHELFGFDTFTGLPQDWVDKDGGIAGKGRAVKGFFTTRGEIPDIDGVTFFKGTFDKTIPVYLNVAQPIALLHIDCDLYDSTWDVLRGIEHLIVPGTIIVFDEWFYNHDPRFSDHEQRAFMEWVANRNREFRFEEFDDRTKSGEERKIVRMTS